MSLTARIPGVIRFIEIVKSSWQVLLGFCCAAAGRRRTAFAAAFAAAGFLSKGMPKLRVNGLRWPPHAVLEQILHNVLLCNAGAGCGSYF